MIKRLKGHLFNNWIFRKFINLLHTIKLGKEKISLYRFFNILIFKLQDDDIFERSYGVAFNITLALFPAIIFVFTLIPWIPVGELDVTIMEFLGSVMPQSIYEVASQTIEDIVSRPRGGLLSFGFFLAMFLATNAMIGIMNAFNRCYKTIENRTWIKMRLNAILLTFLLAFTIFSAVTLLVVVQQIVDYALAFKYLSQFHGTVIYLIRFAMMFLIYFITISSIFYFGPAVKDRWRFFTVGSLVATLLIIGVSFIFSYYLNNFATYNKLYGSIGVMIALMIWLQLISFIILFGYEVNACWDRAKVIYGKKNIPNPEC